MFIIQFSFYREVLYILSQKRKKDYQIATFIEVRNNIMKKYFSWLCSIMFYVEGQIVFARKLCLVSVNEKTIIYFHIGIDILVQTNCTKKYSIVNFHHLLYTKCKNTLHHYTFHHEPNGPQAKNYHHVNKIGEANLKRIISCANCNLSSKIGCATFYIIPNETIFFQTTSKSKTHSKINVQKCPPSHASHACGFALEP